MPTEPNEATEPRMPRPEEWNDWRGLDCSKSFIAWIEKMARTSENEVFAKEKHLVEFLNGEMATADALDLVREISDERLRRNSWRHVRDTLNQVVGKDVPAAEMNARKI